MNLLVDILTHSSSVLLVLALTSVSCSIVGIFLVLRKLSMVSDAISHSVFLGIVLAYFVTHDITSPWLLISAATFGVLTVYAIELVSNTGLVKHNDAVGIIFPLFFSIAVILTTKYAHYVHLDIEIVLMGEVILAPLNTLTLWGITLPKSAWQMGTLLLLNIAFITLYFKELKVSTFDKEFATLMGFSSTLLFYGLMTVASLTTVAAFDAVGAILVISFLIAPPATALMISKSLRSMIIFTIFFALLNSILGFILSILFNVSMSGMTAFVAGIVFFITFLLHQYGPFNHWLNERKQYKIWENEESNPLKECQKRS